MSEKKIKETLYINFKNNKDEKKEKISEWINNQDNYTKSILSLIEHVIDRFGYVDVTDHKIAGKLHTEKLYFEGKDIVPNIQEKAIISDNKPIPKELSEGKKEVLNPHENNPNTNKKENKSPDSELKDFDFGGLDPDSF
ncbi:hypothetical protein MKX83_23995 [Cytobacillus sp. FSL M8-0252]|uniref:hypothetical protein n=1 Tax=Cytobacillus sp. FSL M8-0252 TaxID=2921621 RepID=UPI0030F629E2